MLKDYESLKKWFEESYGHLGYSLSHYYYIFGDDFTDNKTINFRVLYFGEKTKIKGISLEKVIDLTTNDNNLRKLLFDALFRQHGYRVDNDFTPIKEMKKIKL